MKKFSILLTLLIVPLINGCASNDEITQLTYGTIIHKEAIQLSSSEFTTHFENNENFLLTIYPKDSTCLCWKHFSEVIDKAVKDNHLLIYKYYAQDVDDNAIMKELGGFNNRLNAPTFYIIKDKKIAKYYNYTNTTKFFTEKEAFLTEINKHIKMPKLIYIDYDGLKEKINNHESFSILYARNACSDCNYVIPHTLTPYFASLTSEKKDLYIFDMQEYYGTDNYQVIKDEFLLSTVNNPNLGFEGGVVPTFHYYHEGILKDASIYVNEGKLTYSSEEDCYYALNAYYNEERLNYLHYLDNVVNKDMTKIQIKLEDTIEYKNDHYWNISSSSQYYDPILKGFLDTYL